MRDNVGKPVRVAYLVVMFPCYSETFVLREIRELMKRGAEVTILSLRMFSEKIMAEEARRLLPRTVYSPYLFSVGLLRSNILFLLRRPRAYMGLLWLFLSRLLPHPLVLMKTLALFPKSVHFARILQERGVDHIHAHFANYPGTAAYIIAQLTGIPFSMTAHAHDIFQNQLLLCEKTARAKMLFVVSEYNKRFIMEHCPGVPGGKLEVLRCGLDLSRLSFRERGEEDNPVILSVGRLVAIKGIDTLIRAAGILRGRGVGMRCVIAGEGPERRRLERLVASLRLGGVVELIGERTPDEVIELMGRCSLFVLSSRLADRGSGVMDGIPVSLMEAMARGAPVISCDVSGIPELVRAEETGLLVPPGNDGALADAILLLLRDGRRARRLAAAAREKVEREFDIRTTTDRLVKLFGKRDEKD